jgi:hypothetical protein
MMVMTRLKLVNIFQKIFHTITEINYSYFAIYATDDNDDEVAEIMLWQIQPSATPCSPDYSPIQTTLYAGVSVKLDVKKKKTEPKTWKRNVAKDQLNKGLAYNSTLGIEMPAKSMKEPCSLKCMQNGK